MLSKKGFGKIEHLKGELVLPGIVNQLKTGDPKRVTGKQCRPRSDAAERGV